WLNAGTCRSLLIPKVWRTEIVMSGCSKGKAGVGAVGWTDGIIRFYPSSGAGWVRGVAARWSCEIARLQRGISLIDDLEFLFGCLVAAMGVGMVQLDQDLIPRLEAHQGEGRLDFENGERLLARRQRAPRGIPGLVAIAPAALPGPFRAAGEHA